MIIKLNQVAEVKAGNSAPQKDNFSNSGIPFIRAGSLEFLVRNKSIYECEKVGEIEAKTSKLKLFPKGAILFAKSGMSAKMGRVYQLPIAAYVASHLAVIVPNEAIVSSGFLKYYFIGNPPFNLIRDDAYPSIKLSDIESIEIDLPDLLIQNKIVAILDKASSLVNKRQQTIDLMDELLQSKFLEMFGASINNRNYKNVFALGNLIAHGDKINYGIVQPGLEVSNGVPIIRVGDFLNMRINKANLMKVSPEINIKHKNSRLLGGEILIVCVGATIGKVALVDNECSGYNIVRATARINCGDSLNNIYLLNLLRTDFYQNSLKRLARTVAQPTLNIKQISKLEVPVPKIEDQEEFARIFNKYETIWFTLQNSLSELKSLESSILQRAFSGKFRFDISVELDALLDEIDLQKTENDLFSIITNEEYLLNLINRLNKQKFENQDLYDKAKHAAFQLLKEGERVDQEYDDTTKRLNLIVK